MTDFLVKKTNRCITEHIKGVMIVLNKTVSLSSLRLRYVLIANDFFIRFY